MNVYVCCHWNPLWLTLHHFIPPSCHIWVRKFGSRLWHVTDALLLSGPCQEFSILTPFVFCSYIYESSSWSARDQGAQGFKPTSSPLLWIMFMYVTCTVDLHACDWHLTHKCCYRFHRQAGRTFWKGIDLFKFFWRRINQVLWDHCICFVYAGICMNSFMAGWCLPWQEQTVSS